MNDDGTVVHAQTDSLQRTQHIEVPDRGKWYRFSIIQNESSCVEA